MKIRKQQQHFVYLLSKITIMSLILSAPFLVHAQVKNPVAEGVEVKIEENKVDATESTKIKMKIGIMRSPFSAKYLKAVTQFDEKMNKEMTKFFRCNANENQCYVVGLKSGYPTEFLHFWRTRLENKALFKISEAASGAAFVGYHAIRKDSRLLNWVLTHWKEKAFFGIPFSTFLGSSISNLDPRPYYYQSKMLDKNFIEGGEVVVHSKKMSEYTNLLKSALKSDFDDFDDLDKTKEQIDVVVAKKEDKKVNDAAKSVVVEIIKEKTATIIMDKIVEEVKKSKSQTGGSI